VAEPSQGGWATLGKISLLIGVLLGVNQVYIHFIKTEVSVEAEGTCQSTYLPGTLLESLKSRHIFPTRDEIESALPKDLDSKYSIASAIANVSSDPKTRLESAVKDLTSIRSYCSFTVFNNSSKEAQDIKFELPREGIYFIDRLGEEPKEAPFKKVIPVGKLSPGGKVSIATWHQGYTAHEPFDSEQPEFRITHTLGISEVEFLSRNTTSIGWFYERHPYISLLIFACLLVGAVWSGISIEKADAQERAKKDAEKKTEQTVNLSTSTEPVSATDTNPTSNS
jgi:hypothetical protein